MPDYYAEPFLHLAGLTHKSALIAWGSFYFKVKSSTEEFKLVDDSNLKNVFPPRRQTVGARSEPYGKARVEVYNLTGELVSFAETETTNHCWITGLAANTEYSYKVIINGQEWGAGERRDWVSGDEMGLRRIGHHYLNRFRTLPDPAQSNTAPVTFAVLGDFGAGIKKPGSIQRQVADALMRAVDLFDVRFIITTGDNIYASTKIFGIPVGGQGDEDDDWYFTFYQPYRYIINRIPVYPSIGNHDAGETEGWDDRHQLVDNFYINERLAGEEAVGRASTDPGLFYRFRFGSEIEFICLDTSKELGPFGKRLFDHSKHQQFLELAFPDPSQSRDTSTVWRIPFSHHPPFCAGPQHRNTRGMQRLIPLFQRSGVRVVFSGHEHNFQHSYFEGINYFITGGGGKVRRATPDNFDKAHTVSWFAEGHFLLVTIDGDQMSIRPICRVEGDGLIEAERLDPNSQKDGTPLIINRT